MLLAKALALLIVELELLDGCGLCGVVVGRLDAAKELGPLPDERRAPGARLGFWLGSSGSPCCSP
jgi:hypothetical protein